MLKPLELTIYQPLSVYSQAVVDNNLAQGRRAFDYLMLDIHCPGINEIHRKRLTNAELAAEYWRASLGLEYVVTHPDDSGTWDFTTMNEDVRRALILHRFATLPHYDEQGTAC